MKFTVTILATALLATTAVAGNNTTAVRLHKSESVIRFFDNHRWLTAPRTTRCGDIPWTRSCLIARERVRFHTRRINLILEPVTLRNHTDWRGAVHEVQKAFPGTESWLLSCSAAESRHGEWVLYGGRPYYPGAEYAHTFHGWMVGGYLQYMWPTFKGHYRHGLESARSRGFRVKAPPPNDVKAWLSPLGQAIAGGWAILHGQRSHWSASIGNGC